MAQKLEEACQVSLSELWDVGSSGGIWCVLEFRV